MHDFIKIAQNDWIRADAIDRITRDPNTGTITGHLRNGETVVLPAQVLGRILAVDPPPPDSRNAPQQGTDPPGVVKVSTP